MTTRATIAQLKTFIVNGDCGQLDCDSCFYAEDNGKCCFSLNNGRAPTIGNGGFTSTQMEIVKRDIKILGEDFTGPGNIPEPTKSKITPMGDIDIEHLKKVLLKEGLEGEIKKIAETMQAIINVLSHEGVDEIINSLNAIEQFIKDIREIKKELDK